MANKSEEADLLRGQVTDAVAELCMGGLSWLRQIKVEGLLAVTLDDNEVVVVHVNKTCPVPFSSTAHQNGSQLDLNCESGSDTEGQQHVTIKVEKELEQYPSRMNEDGQHQAKCTKPRKKYGKRSRSVAESGQGDLSVQEKKPKTDTSVSSLRLSTPSYATDSSSILVAHTEADLCVHSGTEQPDSMQVPTEWSSVQNKKMPPTNILETKGEGISQTEACFYPEGNLVSNDGDSIAVPASLCDEIATGEVQDADKMLGLCLTSDLDQPETSCQPTDQEASCSSTVANTETTRPKKVTMDISIIQHGGEEEFLESVCGSIQSGQTVFCPLCPEEKFKRAIKSKLKKHLALAHIKHAVKVKSFVVLACFLDGHYSHGEAHYHCPCSKIVGRKFNFERHVKNCSLKVPEQEAGTPGTSSTNGISRGKAHTESEHLISQKDSPRIIPKQVAGRPGTSTTSGISKTQSHTEPVHAQGSKVMIPEQVAGKSGISKTEPHTEPGHAKGPTDMC